MIKKLCLVLAIVLLGISMASWNVFADDESTVTVTAIGYVYDGTPDDPTGLILEQIDETTIRASWDEVIDAEDYLLLVSTTDYPTSPTIQYAIAYSGNSTSVDLIGYDLYLTRYYFSLWSHINPYSITYITAAIGQETLEEQVEDFNGLFDDLNGLVGDLLGILLLALFMAFVFWQKSIVLYALATPVCMVYGLTLASNNEANSPFWVIGVAIAILGTYCLFRIVIIGLQSYKDWRA